MNRLLFASIVAVPFVLATPDHHLPLYAPTSSFSSPEQALFGCSHSEDCIFGSSSSIFSSIENEVMEVKRIKDGSSDSFPVRAPGGFQTTPAFVSNN
jgi:hypothetical protein